MQSACPRRPAAWKLHESGFGSGRMAVTMTGQQRATALFLGGIGAMLAVRAWRTTRALDFKNRSVVIFGGSRGLGLVIARQLVRDGARLALIARDEAELERARQELDEQGVRITTIVCDIREREQVDRAIDQAVKTHGGIDVLINDAGIIQVGPVDHMTLVDFENAMATHFWGPLYTMRAALPYLRQSSAARIVNISSIGGKIAVPHLVPYSASKFALTGLSEGLHAELAKDGIRVTTVCPGLMRTGSTYNAWFKGKHRREFAWFHLADSIPGLSISAERAARQIIEACRRGDAELIITLPARAAVLLNGAFPGALAALMTVANRALPSPAGEAGSEARSGWQSASRFVPSFLTRQADRAAVENNEMPATP
jgi:NAD(P)-dependent dehydrogenase (short-subunit alcohol dehydrogenase family)